LPCSLSELAMQRRDSELAGEAQVCPFLLVAGAERVRVLAGCLASLEPWQRELLLLHYQDGLSLSAIAEEAGVSVQLVSKLHRRALAEMQSQLAELSIMGSSQI